MPLLILGIYFNVLPPSTLKLSKENYLKKLANKIAKSTRGNEEIHYIRTMTASDLSRGEIGKTFQELKLGRLQRNYRSLNSNNK